MSVARVPNGAWRAAFHELTGVLDNAVRERSRRQRVIRTSVGVELEWTIYERRVMRRAVNKIRARYGLDPVDQSAVADADLQASGHVDWAEKFVATCAHLAVNSGVNANVNAGGDLNLNLNRH